VNNTIRHLSNGDFEVIYGVGEMYSYHNTTHSTGSELDQYEAKAKTQEDRIMDWFKSQSRGYCSPALIHAQVFHQSVPITSVRRAMTNLANAGELEKTDLQVKGPYGRPEYTWKLPSGQRRLF